MVGTAHPTDAAAPLERFEFEQPRMGVPFRISVYCPNEAAANTAARAAFARVRQLNAILSDYEPDSELMRLGRNSRPGRPVEVSRELFFVLERALHLSKASDGAFDVTVGPVVRLWREARRSRTLPDPEQLAEARTRVGWRLVRLDRENRTVELLQTGMQLDLGGIAKGYAADEALRVLKEHGIRRALVAAEGDIVVGDPPPGADGWRIDIAPLDTDRDADGPGRTDRHPGLPVLLLRNAAVSTSGDAFQHVEIDGVRYSHIVDPRTGLGVTRRSSVTVVAADGITADSLASAASVLGAERGLELIESRGAAAVFVERHDGRVRIVKSRSLDKYIDEDAQTRFKTGTGP